MTNFWTTLQTSCIGFFAVQANSSCTQWLHVQSNLAGSGFVQYLLWGIRCTFRYSFSCQQRWEAKVPARCVYARKSNWIKKSTRIPPSPFFAHDFRLACSEKCNVFQKPVQSSQAFAETIQKISTVAHRKTGSLTKAVSLLSFVVIFEPFSPRHHLHWLKHHMQGRIQLGSWSPPDISWKPLKFCTTLNPTLDQLGRVAWEETEIVFVKDCICTGSVTKRILLKFMCGSHTTSRKKTFRPHGGHLLKHSPGPVVGLRPVSLPVTHSRVRNHNYVRYSAKKYSLWMENVFEGEQRTPKSGLQCNGRKPQKFDKDVHVSKGKSGHYAKARFAYLCQAGATCFFIRLFLCTTFAKGWKSTPPTHTHAHTKRIERSRHETALSRLDSCVRTQRKKGIPLAWQNACLSVLLIAKAVRSRTSGCCVHFRAPWRVFLKETKCFSIVCPLGQLQRFLWTKFKLPNETGLSCKFLCAWAAAHARACQCMCSKLDAKSISLDKHKMHVRGLPNFCPSC